ncbi:MAG: hypothetical protein ACLGI2_17075 [Acidimicrobiia bacterium]
MRRIGALCAAVGLVVLAAATPTGAQEGDAAVARPAPEPGSARFEGRQIDLRAGWGAARACMVWNEAAVVECFRTPEEMSAREEALAARGGRRTGDSVTASSTWSCSSPLRLYEHGYYGGRQLSFWDAGFWQNLGDWGFNDAVSSYRVGSCHAWMAEHSWGGGEWYPGNTSPWVNSPTMWSGWNDRISSIYNA